MAGAVKDVAKGVGSLLGDATSSVGDSLKNPLQTVKGLVAGEGNDTLVNTEAVAAAKKAAEAKRLKAKLPKITGWDDTLLGGGNTPLGG